MGEAGGNFPRHLEHEDEIEDVTMEISTPDRPPDPYEAALPDSRSNPDTPRLSELNEAQEEANVAPAGRKTRWDPAPAKQAIEQEDFSQDHSRRYNNYRKDKYHYYRDEGVDDKASYDRPGSGFYDRGPHRFSGKNGFDRSSRSRDRRDYYDSSRDYRDRKEYRGADRGDRRQGRSSEEWHYHDPGTNWQVGPQMVSYGSIQTTEGEVYPVVGPIVPVILPAPGVVPQELLPYSAMDDHMESVPESSAVYEEQEAGQLPDESYEPGEVKTVSTSKGWLYINENGDLQGPMELAALKLLASNGFMQEDHLVMRSGTNCWITLERAKSPDDGFIAQLMTPRPKQEEDVVSKPDRGKHKESSLCFDIDRRVERIMKSYPGRDLKSVLAALDVQRRTDEGPMKDFSDPWTDSYDLGFGVDSDLEVIRGKNQSMEHFQHRSFTKPAPIEIPPLDTLPVSDVSSPLKWVPGKWTSKGGDWKLRHPEGQSYVKVVLHDGLLLCDLRNHGADPRRYVQLSETKKKLELPHWAMERNHEVPTRTKPSLSSPPLKTPKTLSAKESGKPIQPVLKKFPDTRMEKHKRIEKSVYSEKPQSKRQFTRFADIESKCNEDLSRGDWYYKDGGGRENGPYTLSELQAMVSKELLLQGTSVYRKSDDLWVPLPGPQVEDPNFEVTEVSTSSFDGTRRVRKVITTNIQQTIVGYTSGQLHEHVMKHYRNQVMSAILFEGLDARLKVIEATKKVNILPTEDSLLTSRFGSPSSSNDTSDDLLREDGEQEHRSVKRPFKLFKANGVNQEQTSKKRKIFYNDDIDTSDDELPPKRTMSQRQQEVAYSDDFEFESSDDEIYEEADNHSWKSLKPSVLMWIYHHLKGDLKSLSTVAMTCRAWRDALERFKPKVKCLNLISIATECTDAVFYTLKGYGGGNLKQISLKECTKLSVEALGIFLEAYPSITAVDINGCDQFGELIQNFPHINWVFYDGDSEYSDSITQEESEDSTRKVKSLRSFESCKSRSTSTVTYMEETNDEDEMDESEPMDIDYEPDIEESSEFKTVKSNRSKYIQENGLTSKGKKAMRTKKITSKVRRSSKSVEEFEVEQDVDESVREWGARMTKAAMVPPLTRKYEVIDDYEIVIDRELVERKMRVELPDNYEEKLRISKQKRGGEYIHLDIPEIKEYQPRQELGVEVLEQEVYGIDPYTHNLMLDSMPKHPGFDHAERLQFMEETLLQAINKNVKHFTGTGKAPIEYPLEPVMERIVEDAREACNFPLEQFSQSLLNNMRSRTKEKYVAYRKGLGVVCNKKGGFKDEDFVVEFLGEVYPAWRWYEKQDGCRYLQKNAKESLPEFYNIYLERPKGDAAGYDLVVVDAMHKANFASRICHSCRPNCEAKVTAVKDRYIIGVYALRPIQDGEELTFDYNSVTESKEEYNNSICLCGTQYCRGSYLNLANAGASQEVIKECHGLLDRHALLLEACCGGPVTKQEIDNMRMAGVGPCLLDGLPDWLLKYTARLVEFINMERQKLPDELIKSARKKRNELCSVEAENQAEGVFNSRLQNIAITLDKVRYVLRQLFTDPREAPPLLKRLDQRELVTRLWSGENSVVSELLNYMTPHMHPDKLSELKRQVHEHSPNDKRSLRESLLWLRDKLRTLEPTFLSRHDAAADLVHLYAYTQCFFTCEEYGTFESPLIEISALDLGRHVNNPATYMWKKTYNKEYVLGQLISWFKQSAADPGASLVQARRGCLVLPDLSSCYAKGLQQDSRRAYGSRLREEMFPRMERFPQKQWPKSQFWEFKSNRGLFGSPMLDAVQRGGYTDVEMMHWLKTRPVNFVGPYDD